MVNLKINENKCVCCGLCAEVCPVNIFKEENGRMAIRDNTVQKHCMSCGQCAAVCPNMAISINGSCAIAEERFSKELLKKQLPLLIRQRRSVRAFKDAPLYLSDIMPILDTVRYSPTGKNMQCVSYLLLTGKSLEDYIKYCYDNLHIIGLEIFVQAWTKKNKDVLFRNAPAVLIAHAPVESHISVTDCTIALTLFDISAPVYDIGTCWAGYVMSLAKHDENMKKYLNLKQGNDIYGILLLGHNKITYTSTPVRKPIDIKTLD